MSKALQIIGLLKPLEVFLYLYVMAPLYHWLGLTVLFIVLYVVFPLLMITYPPLVKKRTRFGNRESPDWLRVTWEPMAPTKRKPWHPDWTYIESTCEPVVRKLGEVYWRIEFICPERHNTVAAGRPIILDIDFHHADRVQ